MLRKLLIIGSIAALFVLSAAPAFGIAVETGPDKTPQNVNVDNVDGVSSPAHGPLCAQMTQIGLDACEKGVSEDNPALGGDKGPKTHPTNSLEINTGAWNAVFGPGGMSNENSAICGITVDHGEAPCPTP